MWRHLLHYPIIIQVLFAPWLLSIRKMRSGICSDWLQTDSVIPRLIRFWNRSILNGSKSGLQSAYFGSEDKLDGTKLFAWEDFGWLDYICASRTMGIDFSFNLKLWPLHHSWAHGGVDPLHRPKISTFPRDHFQTQPYVGQKKGH